MEQIPFVIKVAIAYKNHLTETPFSLFTLISKMDASKRSIPTVFSQVYSSFQKAIPNRKGIIREKDARKKELHQTNAILKKTAEENATYAIQLLDL